MDFIAVVVNIFVEAATGVGDGQRKFGHDVTQCTKRFLLLLVVTALAKGLVGWTKVRYW